MHGPRKGKMPTIAVSKELTYTSPPSGRCMLPYNQPLQTGLNYWKPDVFNASSDPAGHSALLVFVVGNQDAYSFLSRGSCRNSRCGRSGCGAAGDCDCHRQPDRKWRGDSAAHAEQDVKPRLRNG